jgi:hypothetical protein
MLSLSVFKKHCFLALMITAAVSAFCFGKKEAVKPPQAENASGTENAPRLLDEVTVSGRVRLTGTALFPQLIITDAENRDWYIDEADRSKLADLEQRGVIVRGKAFVQDMILANGKSAGLRYTLRDISVLH